MKKLLLTFAAICFSLTLFAQQTVEKHIVEIDYLRYLPEGYATETNSVWPVLVFLHGAGETGTNINKVKHHGPPKLIEAGKQFPFIVLSLQAQTRGWKPAEIHDLLQKAFAGLRVDRDRIYLTGLSMGGFGTWTTAAAYPEMFAAIVPICGGGDASKAEKLRNMPIWCFHGDQDRTVPLSASENMVNAVKQYNPNVTFTVYPGVGHDSWTATYANDAVYEWLLQQKRHENKTVELSPEILNTYATTYVSESGNAIRFKVKDNGLQLFYGNLNVATFYPHTETEFYYDRHSPDYVRFETDEAGSVTGGSIMFLSEKGTFRKK